MSSSSGPVPPSKVADVVEAPDASFDEPERVELINKIANALNALNEPKIKNWTTCYGCLWLADIEKLRALVNQALPDNGEHDALRIYDKFFRVENEGCIGQNWQQKKGSAQSRAPSAPPTPARNTPPPLFLSSPALGRSPGDLVSEPPTSTPQRQRLSLGTSGSPSASHKRAGDPQSTPKGAKKLKLDTAVWESTKDPRSQEAADECKKRDKACILTKFHVDFCQSCHLFPYCMNNENTQGVQWFFRALRDFWSKERVDGWRNAVYGDATKTEKIQNLITLNYNAHQLHTKALFALQPVDRDEVHDGVEFSVRPQLPEDFCPTEYAVALHNIYDNLPLVSGDYITLETHNPETHPLPDTRLLDMQWMLNRVLALRGAAEPEELKDELDEDSDEGLGLIARPEVPLDSSFYGESSPPSSITNIASDQPKANPVIATTDTVEQGLIKE
ncbi:hypothetical protein CNMCM7691_001518 [Aspergillus felis]|uniref:HNH nuclease domain-containing protein n=1 Tax=Aspergillus felis TaxID=1287682 RepID=A0A8H6QYV5_9EURO|nr:hypothetical protein CNMCM7691_001518 [Aspergillus felis]